MALFEARCLWRCRNQPVVAAQGFHSILVNILQDIKCAAYGQACQVKWRNLYALPGKADYFARYVESGQLMDDCTLLLSHIECNYKYLTGFF